ncbi:MAG: WYL domain-containing protein [Pseudacidovorax sp.]|uniref:helix-turn-helix transcriptional regulator n=1 Tax=Pseudacidovorax sp. TaxID=1934311 RepID=UPI001B609A2E|nr:WYL domain-containing protein [Pseudacidovorax sp.]MBP6898342.1 WYL domain-containing protein [Pseudacidovorax sp.]MBP6901077.1 WYL domain-containing protein [Burkholderiaceae bacterium]
MSKTARLYKIEMLIRSRGHVSFQALLDELEVSSATLKRDLACLRDELGAPIEYDAALNGYKFGSAGFGLRGAQRHELPGLWFSERELYSLLMAHQLLSGLDTEGLLSRHLQPLLERIHDLLGPGDESAAKVLMKRVKIISALRRPVPAACFERVGEALVRRQRLHMRYLTRTRGEVSERQVSPQRLVHYKNTWYLDAWCHSRDKLLRFALDAVQEAQVLEARAKDVAMRQVEAEMDSGYGIYAGGTRRLAVLLFSPQAAAWIRHEEWHPEQQGELLADGSWQLTLPYVDETELVMDLLRQGEQVRVLAPDSLREAVRRRLAAALQAYAQADAQDGRG